MQKYLQDYADRCLRFYAQEPNLNSKTKQARKDDWLAASKAFNKLFKHEPYKLNYMLDVYRRKDTLANNIYEISIDVNMAQETLWFYIRRLRVETLKARGLL